MTKQFVKWHTISIKNREGEYYESGFPEIVDRAYRGELLCRILSMPKKKPIGFEDAVRKADNKCMAAILTGHAEETRLYIEHFVEWTSERGYHIVLTGDEFESMRFPYKLF